MLDEFEDGDVVWLMIDHITSESITLHMNDKQIDICNSGCWEGRFSLSGNMDNFDVWTEDDADNIKMIVYKVKTKEDYLFHSRILNDCLSSLLMNKRLSH